LPDRAAGRSAGCGRDSPVPSGEKRAEFRRIYQAFLAPESLSEPGRDDPNTGLYSPPMVKDPRPPKPGSFRARRTRSNLLAGRWRAAARAIRRGRIAAERRPSRSTAAKSSTRCGCSPQSSTASSSLRNRMPRPRSTLRAPRRATLGRRQIAILVAAVAVLALMALGLLVLGVEIREVASVSGTEQSGTPCG